MSSFAIMRMQLFSLSLFRIPSFTVAHRGAPRSRSLLIAELVTVSWPVWIYLFYLACLYARVPVNTWAIGITAFAAALATAASCARADRLSFSWRELFWIGLSQLLFLAGALLAVWYTFDLSYDGSMYHGPAIQTLRGGWNPVFEQASDFLDLAGAWLVPGPLPEVQLAGRSRIRGVVRRNARGVFLDITDRVTLDGPEAGLLTVAPHPRFTENGQFFVFYTPKRFRGSVIARFTADPKTFRADPSSETVLLEVEHPIVAKYRMSRKLSHHGGSLVFAADGTLFVSVGEARIDEWAQDLRNPYGKILRIDPDRSENGKPYGIPPNNPFADRNDGTFREIWAYGCRNPWRIGLDSQTGELYAGDVGDATYEEINRVVPGGNYGWPLVEGAKCYRKVKSCSTWLYREPMVVTGRPRKSASAIIGGVVYRGREIPELNGRYLFGNLTTGLYAATPGGPGAPATELIRWRATGDRTPEFPRQIFLASIAEDADHEIYLLDLTGAIFKLVRSTP